MNMTMRRRVAILSIPILAASLAGRAQSAPQGAAVQEKAIATVIEIPVNVVGKDGKPVLGLKPEDFTLYDDGKKQPINAVEMIDLGKAAVAAGAPAEAIPASARRLWLMVFDMSYASPSGLVRARDGAREFVTKAMKENDLASVATLSMDTGWKLLVNFTHDRAQLAAAIDTLGLPSLALRSSDPLAFAYTNATLGSDQSALGPRGAGNSDKEGALLESLRDIRNIQKQATDDYERGRVLKLLNSFAGIGRVLDSVRGRKHVLYFSEGFETRLLTGGQAGGGRGGSSIPDTQASASLDATTTLGTNEAAVSGEIWKVDSDARFGSSSLRDTLKLSLSYFNRSDAVIDAIDISGLRAEGDPSGPRRSSGTDALFTLAAETDGDFVRNANQLGSDLQKVADRTSIVYLVAYQPKQLTKPGTFHKLKVDVKASGAKVLARSGYTEPRPYASLTPLEQLLVSGDLLTGGRKGDEIPAHLLVAPFPSRAEAPQVPIVLEIPGKTLLAGDTGEKTNVQIYAYANDAAGTLTDYLTSVMTLDLQKVRPTLESGGIKYYGTLYLSPGEYQVRALVRNASTGRAGVVSARVLVPQMPGGSPTVLAPLFYDPTGNKWAMIRGNPRADAPQRMFEYPFSLGGDSFVPAALPTVSEGNATQVAVFTYNFGGDAKKAPLQVRGEIVGADGTSRPVELTVTKESDRERAEGRKLLLSFKPSGLSPGRYALKVAVTDPASKTTGEAQTPFEVH